MKKVILILFFFLLNGCSLDSLLALREVDKAQVVRSSSYVKFYRAYLTRSHLKPIKNNQKYIYFYNAKTKDLSILVHRKNKYILYSLYHPKKDAIVLKTTSKTSYKHILNILKHKNYFPTTCAKIACTSHIALRRYKGIKTLLIEVKDYSRLQNMYKKAIRNYQSKIIKPTKIKLPKAFISSYFKFYEKRANTQKQLDQLHIIATKLNLNSTTKTNKEDISNTNIKNEAPKELVLPYSYYLNYASYDDITQYLANSQAKDSLSAAQYDALIKKQASLKEEYVLHHASLEELITEYKKNKNPRYKTQILLLMKKAQENK